MKNYNTITGNKGEIIAQNYIKKIKKYKILECNYKNKIGEIDVVAKYKDIIVFIEVKTKNSLLFGRPCEMVTPHKISKIKKVSLGYLISNRLENNKCRFDVIEVLGDEINYIEDAFQ